MAEKPDYDGSQPLKSGRQELFCQGIVSGKSQTKAYIEAGYSEIGADGHAARLVVKGMIKARIAAIWAKIAEYAKVTQEGQSKKFAKVQEICLANGENSTYVRAVEGQNRLYGLEKQVIEQTEAQRQLTETQSAEARRIAEIRAREKAGLTVPEAEKVPQNGTERREYALDWTNDKPDEDDRWADQGKRQEQTGQEQDAQQAFER